MSSPIRIPQLLTLAGLAASPAPNSTLLRWIAVRPRFEQFNQELALTARQEIDACTKWGGVVNSLNRHYYGTYSRTDNSFLIGSWAKGTAGRPPRDVDLYFVLPYEVYQRFQNYVWNRQSALLQEMKEVLSVTYPETDMTADGQIVLVRFDSYNVEVVPAFALTNGRYWICDTNNGGRYKETAPPAERDHIETSDQATNRNLRAFIRMCKAWQETCAVPIKSFHLELIAAEFLLQSPWRMYDFFWFDWIARDFFLYLYTKANSWLRVPGTGEMMHLGNEWQSRAESAFKLALKACAFEWENRVEQAGEEWQKIFGFQIPRTA
jgi:hypothetical protein